jgi:hypothetical protein
VVWGTKVRGLGNEKQVQKIDKVLISIILFDRQEVIDYIDYVD